MDTQSTNCIKDEPQTEPEKSLTNHGLFGEECRETIINGLCRGKAFNEMFQLWLDSPICRRVADIIHKRGRAAGNLPCSYRILHHWEESNLIECERKSESGWRKFSLLEEAWLRVIHSLREFGMSIEKIAKAKSAFFAPHRDESRCALMEYYIGSAIGWGAPVSLLVFSDGGAEPLNYRELQVATKLFGLTDHIHLNINEILRQSNTPHYISPKFPYEMSLSNDELTFLLLVRLQQFKSVTIHSKNGKIERIEAKRDCDVASEKIGDILRLHDYQKIEMVKNDDRVISIQQTLSFKS